MAIGIVGVRILRTVFRLLPAFFCLMLYNIILKAVSRWDPSTESDLQERIQGFQK